MNWTEIVLMILAALATWGISRIPAQLGKIGKLVDTLQEALKDGKITMTELRQILTELRKLVWKKNNQVK